MWLWYKISDGSKHSSATCLQHLFTDVEEASLILEKQSLLLLQPLAKRSDLNTVRITKVVFTHKFYHHAALNVGQFKALLGWSISCTSRSFCSIRFREIINSSSLRLSRVWTSCSSVSQSRFCCWIIRSICLIRSWSSGSQEERTELETQYKPPTQVKAVLANLAPRCKNIQKLVQNCTLPKFKLLYLGSIFSWENWRTSISLKSILAGQHKWKCASSEQLEHQPFLTVILPVYTR